MLEHGYRPRAGSVHRSTGIGPPGLKPQQIVSVARIQYRPGREFLHLAQTTKIPDASVLAVFLGLVSLVADAIESEHGAVVMTLHTARVWWCCDTLGGRDVPAHMRATRPSCPRSGGWLCHFHPRPAAVGRETGRSRAFVLGPADAQPGVGFCREAPQGAHRQRRTRSRRSSAPVSGAGRFGSARLCITDPARGRAGARCWLQVGDREPIVQIRPGRVEEGPVSAKIGTMSLIDFGESSGRVKRCATTPLSQAARFRAEREVAAAISRISRPVRTRSALPGQPV